MFDVCLLGTGGMMPKPDRWLTSLMTRYNGSNLLIDCGEGTQIAIQKQGWSFKSIDTICITHFHADHISGLPGILLAMANSDRTKTLTMIGPKGLSRVVNSLRVIAADLPFEIEFMELTEAVTSFKINGYELTAFRLKHNCVCYGYSLQIRRAGRFDVQKAEEIGIPVKYWNRLQKGSVITDGDVTYTPDMVLGKERKGIKITYATDTRPITRIAECAEGSDIFICESMYGFDEEEDKAKEHKHMTMREGAILAAEAGVGELWFTHYSPSFIDPGRQVRKARNIFKNSVAGEDGMFRELRFEDEE